MVRLAVLSAVLLVALPVAGAAASRHTVRVDVHPESGGAHTRFVVSFRAPAASGSAGGTVVHYQVDASLGRMTPPGCVAALTVPIGSVGKGQHVRVGLRPHGRWCAGRFAGAVRETVTPQCSEGKPCPLFIAQLIVGRFSFRVRQGSPA